MQRLVAEKVLALMEKFRKRQVTSLQVKDLIPVLNYLGGWAVGETYVWESRDEVVRSKFKDDVEKSHKELKDHEVSVLPAPSAGAESIITDVGDIFETSMGDWMFEYQDRYISTHTTVTAPNGELFTSDKRSEDMARAFVTQVRDEKEDIYLIKWLWTKTSFEADIAAKLNLPTFQQAESDKVQKQRTPTKENTGTCPCCFRVQKLSPASTKGSDHSRPGMVLHGYSRPGFGYIIGNCFGVGYPPYQLSSEGTTAFRIYMRDVVLVQLDKDLSKLKNDPPPNLDENVTVYTGKGSGYEKKTVSHSKGTKDYDRVLQYEIDSVNADIRSVNVTINELAKAEENWKPQELGTRKR